MGGEHGRAASFGFDVFCLPDIMHNRILTLFCTKPTRYSLWKTKQNHEFLTVSLVLDTLSCASIVVHVESHYSTISSCELILDKQHHNGHDDGSISAKPLKGLFVLFSHSSTLYFLLSV